MTSAKRIRESSLHGLRTVRRSTRLQFGSASYKARKCFTIDKPKNTSLAATCQSGTLLETQCTLKDREHKIWKRDNFRKIRLSERHEAVEKCKLCFSCLVSGHRVGQCKHNRLCGKDGCSKRHLRLLHSDNRQPKIQNQQKSNFDNNTDAVLTANLCSGSFQIVLITF